MTKAQTHSKFISSYNDISLKILHLANKGISLERFKYQTTEIIIEFSKSDAVEVFIIDHDDSFFWRAERSDKKHFFIGNQTADDSITGFYKTLLNKSSSELQVYDRDCLPDLIKSRPAYKEFVSQLLIPYRIDNSQSGLLSLKSRQANFYGKDQYELFIRLAQTLGIAVSNRRAQFELKERIKELTCLYGISRIIQQPGLSLDDILQRIVDSIPDAFQYPDAVTCRLHIDHNVFASGVFSGGEDLIRSAMPAHGTQRGFIEVMYRGERDDLQEAPFLKEEQNLLDTIAKQVGIVIEDRRNKQEKKRLQEQLFHADRLATIGELAAGVAHELNEPLVNILGFAQLIIKDTPLPGQTKNDINKIIDASLHAREIVKKLLLFSRQAPSSVQGTNLNKIISDGLYFLKSRCKKKGIKLTLFLDPDLPDIMADPAQINQILVNLVVNSIYALPDGGEIIVSTNAGGDDVCFSVRDDGAGMDQQTVKQIFFPFFTTKEIGEGTGLGLAVVHGIVTAHGGKITVSSTEGKGTLFDVIFPAARKDSI